MGFKAETESHNADYEWRSVRSVGPQIQRHDAALVAAVNGMMEWHIKNQVCGETGDALIPDLGGYARRKENSIRHAFPRIDPAMICLVTCGEYCLLGRKPEWRERTR